jgi:hypothetical protein
MEASAADKLRTAVEAIASDPDVVIEELAIAPPADPALVLRARAELPELPTDLVDFLAANDGFRFQWQSRRDPNNNGGLHVPPLEEALVLLTNEWGLPLRYVMIDDLQDGTACYYRIDCSSGWKQPSPATIIFAEIDHIEATTYGEVCKSFAEYLHLAERHRFHWSWPGDHVVRRRHGEA